MCELESLVIAVGELRGNIDFMKLSIQQKISKLLSEVRLQKKIGTKQDRKNKILEGNTTKISKRYARGYDK